MKVSNWLSIRPPLAFEWEPVTFNTPLESRDLANSLPECKPDGSLYWGFIAVSVGVPINTNQVKSCLASPGLLVSNCHCDLVSQYVVTFKKLRVPRQSPPPSHTQTFSLIIIKSHESQRGEGAGVTNYFGNILDWENLKRLLGQFALPYKQNLWRRLPLPMVFWGFTCKCHWLISRPFQ